jgi:ATP/maltotriose-dependent transcriptional regulator MalT
VIDDYQTVAGASAAERFLETLLREAPLNVLLMSRRRPGWASSRRVLYGELWEMDRAALAMNDEEARELLQMEGAGATRLVALAQGWPAVLALAAISDATLPDLTAAPHLYRFFADEIYRRIDRRLRRTLCELALYDTAGRHLALSQLRPSVIERVIAIGVDSGFLSERYDKRLDMHPLLRTFLQRKLETEHPAAARESFERAAGVLIQHGLWDEAFDLIVRVKQERLIPDLIGAAMDELLTSGRAATLRSWIAHAARDVPVVRLATAELAFREGRYYESEALAELAARDLEEPDMAARANVVAGRAAHVASREDRARAYFRAAQEVGRSHDLVRRAALGELVAAIELEHADAERLLATAASHKAVSPEDQVLMADRKLAFETRFGRPVDLQSGREAQQLLQFVADPVARSSFRNVFGYALASSAMFAEATAITEDQIEDAERCRLDFVVPYALAIMALVGSGQRAYTRAEELLDEADDRALAAGDWAAYQIASAVRMRLYIAQAAFDLAIERGRVEPVGATRSLRAELTAAHALAAAAIGRAKQARELAHDALEMSIGVEGMITAHCALAVLAIRDSNREEGLSHARTALDRSVYTGMIDCLVSAYRGCPELIVCLLEDERAHDHLSAILTKVGDMEPTLLPTVEAPKLSVMALSPREKEVLSLLAQGLSNVAIGNELFISPKTVKVHVRHIFEKLGVSSRAAAALRATQLNRN